jgi:hypothetical protein
MSLNNRIWNRIRSAHGINTRLTPHRRSVGRCRRSNHENLKKRRTYIQSQQPPLLLTLRLHKVNHHITAALSTEQMRFALLSEEILLQFGFGVGEEVDIFALGVDE